MSAATLSFHPHTSPIARTHAQRISQHSALPQSKRTSAASSSLPLPANECVIFQPPPASSLPEPHEHSTKTNKHQRAPSWKPNPEPTPQKSHSALFPLLTRPAPWPSCDSPPPLPHTAAHPHAPRTKTILLHSELIAPTDQHPQNEPIPPSGATRRLRLHPMTFQHGQENASDLLALDDASRCCCDCACTQRARRRVWRSAVHQTKRQSIATTRP